MAAQITLFRWYVQTCLAVAPAPRIRRACPRLEDRPPPVADLVSRPSSYLCGQAGTDAL